MVTVYQSCVNMLEKVGIKHGEIITLDNLKTLIIRHIGGQPTTINQALNVMGQTGLLKDIGNCRFKLIKNAK